MVYAASDEAQSAAAKPRLARRINLGLAVLFGLGVTIGAGIYVLIGAAAGRAGMHAPLAFLLAAVVMAPTAASMAELASRYPVSAGEAAYVKAGFRSDRLALLIGIAVIAVGILSAAAISRGSSGYIRDLTGLPVTVILPAVILATGLTAAWGIKESLTVAAVLTVIEISGLLAIIVVGGFNAPGLISRLPEVWTGVGNLAALTAILSASLLAFFAFIGFESLANIAEEVIEPEKTLPKAILITLGLSALLYFAVMWVALVSVPQSELAKSDAPLSLVFSRVTGASPTLITVIAIVATVNGIIAQMVMSSRVIYGLADQKQLPAFLSAVDRTTRTPLIATSLVVGLVLLLAVALPLETLAEWTTRTTLLIFTLINAALVLIKYRCESAEPDALKIPAWVPALGTLLCIGLLVGTLIA